MDVGTTRSVRPPVALVAFVELFTFLKCVLRDSGLGLSEGIQLQLPVTPEHCSPAFVEIT